MRSNATLENRIAVVHQMMCRDRGSYITIGIANIIDSVFSRDMFEYYPQGWQGFSEGLQDAIDEYCLAIEYIHLMIRHLAMN